MAIVEMLRCGMCGKREAADSMKYDSKKQLNICTDCYEKQKIGSAEPRVKSQLITRAVEAETGEKPEEEKKSYKCASCGYIFASSHFENVCPYCGKKGTVRKRMQEGAEDI